MGLALFFAGPVFASADDPYLVGWIGMAGTVLTLHFGLFHLLSCAWHLVGVNARPLIEAAERSKQDAEGGDITGVPQALRELGDLATWVLPVHGLFVPNNNEVCMAVERVARQHLDLEEARREMKEALSVVVEFAQRDPIESAVNHVRSASEEAYFYAGLAFGLTFAEYRSLSSR